MKARNASTVVADFSAEGTTSDSLGCKSQVPGFEAPWFLERSTANAIDRERGRSLEKRECYLVLQTWDLHPRLSDVVASRLGEGYRGFATKKLQNA